MFVSFGSDRIGCLAKTRRVRELSRRVDQHVLYALAAALAVLCLAFLFRVLWRVQAVNAGPKIKGSKGEKHRVRNLNGELSFPVIFVRRV
jgi:hypothetical protein